MAKAKARNTSRKPAARTQNVSKVPADSDILLRESAKKKITTKIFSSLRGPKSNEVLTERKIVEDLDLTRAPVRQALSELENDGVVTIAPRVGAMIQVVTAENFHLNMATRYSLEPYLVSLIARPGFCDLSELVDTHARMPALISEARASGMNDDIKSNIIQADVDFHGTIARLAAQGLSNHERYVRSVCSQMFLYIIKSTPLELRDVERILEDHQAILDAILANDDVAAKSATQKHIRDSVQELEARAQARYRELS